ncbi:hypothetical protein [Bradyrhizobium sp. CCGUVB14]|uniref:hypothetical protein n=1 Tax=Bradyrhizobium sp. CCGUVB14 TaxID=2949628 RepID=UPI0020B2B6C5|nr:hypothetical protein [Bradyrhizobium sp. CCGUVB14]MCP3444207.1 hypothetical protein [Bradyrhizobium sp. CCGUVB14]
MAVKKKASSLSHDALIGVVGCVLGLGGTAFDPGWVGRGLLVLAASLLIAYAAWRHGARPLWRSAAAVVLITLFVGLSWKPIWLDFHKNYRNVAFRWPITFSEPPLLTEPSDMPPLDLPGAPLSKWGKVLYLCPLPPQVDPAERTAAKEALRRNADIYGNALGISIVFNDIPYGIRFDVTPAQAEGQARMGMAQRLTFQLEIASKGLFVTVTTNMLGGMGILEAVGIDRDSDIEKLFKQQVELVVGAKEGTCRLL